MLGRVRKSSSPDSLGRTPSKILKGDSLSIYEATLMKMKLGSKRDLSSPCEEAVDKESNSTSIDVLKSSQHLVFSPSEEAMAIDTDGSFASPQSSSSVCQSARDSRHQWSRDVSIVYLFSKYNDSRHAPTSSSDG